LQSLLAFPSLCWFTALSQFLLKPHNASEALGEAAARVMAISRTSSVLQGLSLKKLAFVSQYGLLSVADPVGLSLTS
jgi:hypothetical protein